MGSLSPSVLLRRMLNGIDFDWGWLKKAKEIVKRRRYYKPIKMGTTNQVKLRIDNLSLSFGGVRALIDVSLDIRENEILAIIGPNGAGKTCIFNCINGFYKPQEGEIYYGSKRITRMRPDKVAKFGIARTFQNIELYT